MLRAGDTLENPITRERLVFVATAAETAGECTMFDTYVRPNGIVAASHVHPYQTELFDIRSGRIGIKLGRKTIEAGPGEVLTIQPRVPHRFWNAGDDELHFRATVTPALEFESLIETMFTLAADGKTNKKGMPNPFRLAVIARAHFDVVRLPVIPHTVQRIALALGAPAGRAMGYGAMYAPAAGVPAVAAF